MEVEAGELDAGYGNWYRDQRVRFEADGSYPLAIPYSQSEERIMDILRYGPGCSVLEPPELRAKVCERLEQARHNYG